MAVGETPQAFQNNVEVVNLVLVLGISLVDKQKISVEFNARVFRWSCLIAHFLLHVSKSLSLVRRLSSGCLPARSTALSACLSVDVVRILFLRFVFMFEIIIVVAVLVALC